MLIVEYCTELFDFFLKMFPQSPLLLFPEVCPLQILLESKPGLALLLHLPCELLRLCCAVQPRCAVCYWRALCQHLDSGSHSLSQQLMSKLQVSYESVRLYAPQ